MESYASIVLDRKAFGCCSWSDEVMVLERASRMEQRKHADVGPQVASEAALQHATALSLPRPLSSSVESPEKDCSLASR